MRPVESPHFSIIFSTLSYISAKISSYVNGHIFYPYFERKEFHMDKIPQPPKTDIQDEQMPEYYYNMLMSSMNVSVSKHLMDEYFTVIWANDYFYERTLYTKEEYEAIYRNRCSDYFKQDLVEFTKFKRAIETAIENGDPGYECICKMPQKGGGYIWIKITGRFTEETCNGIPVIYSVFTDVTQAVEQRELQKELEQRTKQLKEALEMAETANREKTNFLSRMSHDIRTPMNAIIGMTDIAAAHLDNPDKMKDCLKKIALSSQHLLGLINDVLDMSRIESGKMTLSIDAVSFSDFMENVVAIMQPGIKAKRQHFDVRLVNVKHEHFYSDSLRLRQLFINILSNASKFTPPEGHISLEIEELPSDLPKTACMKFTFTDSGIGIKPEFLEHIFDAFSRERDSRVDQTEGSGLGMAISRKIVDMLHGTIDVASEPDKGTAFTVTLPLRICETQPQEVRFPGLKLLLVDDDRTMCEYMVEMLKGTGVEADWAESGEEAVEKVMEQSHAGEAYDAVILDWQMPGLDGIQTTKKIREKMGRELPVLIISSYDWADIEEDAVSAGVNGFMMKPVFMSTLSRGLQKYVLGEKLPEEEALRPIDLTGKRFLLVEDNELNREIAVEMLASKGAVMECACDGAECVEKFKDSPAGYYDLILMDVQMPVMNGYEATRAIRAMPREDAEMVPILAMTADAFTEDINEAKNAGMNGHLAKPLDLATLLHEIGRYCQPAQ